MPSARRLLRLRRPPSDERMNNTQRASRTLGQALMADSGSAPQGIGRNVVRREDRLAARLSRRGDRMPSGRKCGIDAAPRRASFQVRASALNSIDKSTRTPDH
jgi:hypothetical protein